MHYLLTSLELMTVQPIISDLNVSEGDEHLDVEYYRATKATIKNVQLQDKLHHHQIHLDYIVNSHYEKIDICIQPSSYLLTIIAESIHLLPNTFFPKMESTQPHNCLIQNDFLQWIRLYDPYLTEFTNTYLYGITTALRIETYFPTSNMYEHICNQTTINNISHHNNQIDRKLRENKRRSANITRKSAFKRSLPPTPENSRSTSPLVSFSITTPGVLSIEPASNNDILVNSFPFRESTHAPSGGSIFTSIRDSLFTPGQSRQSTVQKEVVLDIDEVNQAINDIMEGYSVHTMESGDTEQKNDGSLTSMYRAPSMRITSRRRSSFTPRRSSVGMSFSRSKKMSQVINTTGWAQISQNLTGASSVVSYADIKTGENTDENKLLTEDLIESIWDEIDRIDIDESHKGNWFLRWLFSFFTVGRLYFFIVVSVNSCILGTANYNIGPHSAYFKSHTLTLTLWNFMLCVLLRNEIVVYILYVIGFYGGQLFPVPVRHLIVEGLLQIGSIHSSAGIMTFVWLLYAAYQMQSDPEGVSDYLIVCINVILALIAMILIMGIPPLRYLYHNQFEWTHRFAGWTALVTLWAALFLFYSYQCDENSNDDTATNCRYDYNVSKMFSNPEIYIVTISTISIFLPWFATRKVPVRCEFPSKSVAFLHFKGYKPYGHFSRISHNPLIESHAFAISSTPGKDEHFLIVGAVGDFTKGLHTTPPTHLYTRQFKFTGLSRMVCMYNRAVIVATGAGVAVFNSIIWQNLKLDSETCCFRLLWVASNIEQTFGKEWCDQLMATKRVLLYDTKLKGRPDMVKLTLQLYSVIKAEVVLVTSNPSLTDALVLGCRKRGVAAFGPIFDS